MSKTLEEKFRSFCSSKNLEINQNQITTIKLLQDFYNKNFHSLILNFFKKENHKKSLKSLFFQHQHLHEDKILFLNFFF